MEVDLQTIIIGKTSNFSAALSKKLDKTYLISAKNIKDSIRELDSFKNQEINIIFNNFQTATKLNELDDPSEYIERSITATAHVLTYIKENNFQINKIIYTSSGSVYGNNVFCSEDDLLSPLNLHAALKISNEMLIKKFCMDNEIDYTLARIFNMYGENDKFSVVSKIENSVKNDIALDIVNNGNAIRDFIHIADVCKIYKHIIMIKNIPVLNIGTGNGSSIKNILDFLKNHGIHVKVNNVMRNELKVSTSNNGLLLSIVGQMDFIKVEEYLLKKINDK